MYYINVVLLLLTLYSCKSFEKDQYFDRVYYEKVTQIKFPDKYKIITSADNGEFLTVTILDLDKFACNTFVKDNNFRPVDTKHAAYRSKLFGFRLLDSSYRQFANSQTLLERSVDKLPGKVGWIYLVDTASCRLYCEIEYPDQGGN